jgi:hypothetical protein
MRFFLFGRAGGLAACHFPARSALVFEAIDAMFVVLDESREALDDVHHPGEARLVFCFVVAVETCETTPGIG